MDPLHPPELFYEKAILNFKLHQHTERASGFLTKLSPAMPIILGLEWLRLHNPIISWARNSITLNSNFCRQHCLQDGRPVTVIGLSKEDTQASPQAGLARIHMARPSPRTNTDDTSSSESTGKSNSDLGAALDTTQPPASQDDKRKAHQRPVLARIIGGVRWSPKKRRPNT
jgi:hypothetical protein